MCNYFGRFLYNLDQICNFFFFWDKKKSSIKIILQVTRVLWDYRFNSLTLSYIFFFKKKTLLVLFYSGGSTFTIYAYILRTCFSRFNFNFRLHYLIFYHQMLMFLSVMHAIPPQSLLHTWFIYSKKKLNIYVSDSKNSISISTYSLQATRTIYIMVFIKGNLHKTIYKHR